MKNAGKDFSGDRLQAVAQITTRIVFVGSSNNLSNARTREEVRAGLDSFTTIKISSLRNTEKDLDFLLRTSGH